MANEPDRRKSPAPPGITETGIDGEKPVNSDGLALWHMVVLAVGIDCRPADGRRANHGPGEPNSGMEPNERADWNRLDIRGRRRDRLDRVAMVFMEAASPQ